MKLFPKSNHHLSNLTQTQIKYDPESQNSLLVRVYRSRRRNEIERRQPGGVGALELIELLPAAAEQVLDVKEVLAVYLAGVAAELGGDDRLDAAAIVGGLGPGRPEEPAVEGEHLLLHPGEPPRSVRASHLPLIYGGRLAGVSGLERERETADGGLRWRDAEKYPAISSESKVCKSEFCFSLSWILLYRIR